MPKGPFDGCTGKRPPLPESAGRLLTYLVEPSLAKLWCGDLLTEAECDAKSPCVWQYKARLLHVTQLYGARNLTVAS